MPLNTRDILVVIRARDTASRVIAQIGSTFARGSDQTQAMGKSLLGVGTAAVGVGAVFGTLGAIGIAAMADITSASMRYNTAASMTLTQVDRVGVGLTEIKDIGRDVAAAIPAPFEQMQEALFDIFSSINTGVGGARVLLTAFSKAAVAGQTEIVSASRATIGMMNAFKIPISDVNSVLDVQFQLVRKGIITYDELVSNIGKAIPAFAAAGQEITTMAGAFAFLTRQGVTVAMSATSIARAMELVARPDSVRNLERLGVQVRTSSGEFRQLNQIVTDMATGPFKNLTGPEFRTMFTSIFGQGTIQARRFFDLAIPNYKSLNRLTKDMQGSSGAMQQAYDIMFKDPAVQAQLLRNNIEVLKTELGDELLPVVLKLIQAGLGLVRWLRSVPEPLQRVGILFAAGSSALLLFSGIVIAVGGAIAILVGGLTMLGVPLGVAIAGFGLAGVALATLVGAVILITQHWDTLVGIFNAAPEVFITLAAVITGVLIGGAIMKLVSGLATLAMSLATTSAAGATTTAVFGTMGTALAAAAPWLALIGVAVAGVITWLTLDAAAAEDAAKANEELTQAMEDQNAAFGASSEAFAQSWLQDRGILDDINRMGIGMNDLERIMRQVGTEGTTMTSALNAFDTSTFTPTQVQALAHTLSGLRDEYILAEEVFTNQQLSNSLEEIGSASAQAQGDVNLLFSTVEQAQEWESGISDAILGATEPVKAMGDEWENAFTTWRDNMNLMLTATANWQRNLATLAAQGRTDLMMRVAEQGVDFAPVLQDAINRGSGALDEMEDIFATRATQAGEGFSINFADAMDLVATFQQQGPLALSEFERFGAHTRDQALTLAQDVNARLRAMGSGLRIRLEPPFVAPFREKLAEAQNLLHTFRQTKAEATLNADNTRARDALHQTMGEIRRDWIAQVFGTELDADSRPARRVFREALRQGRNFDASRWAAILDANGTPAENEIDRITRLAEEFGISTFTARLAVQASGSDQHLLNLAGLERGGPVRLGESYIVGESGPEIFTPGSSGRITPNSGGGSMSGGGGGGDTIVVSPEYNISGTNIQGPELMRILRKHDQELVDIIRKKGRSGK